jgi:beta-lactamase class A
VRRGANLWAVLGGTVLGGAVGFGALLLALPLFQKPAPPVTNPAAQAPAAPETPPPLRPRVNLVQLNALLLEETEKIPGNVAVHVRFEGGSIAGVRFDEPMPAASLIKLPIMVVLEASWGAGLLSRRDRDYESIQKAITESDNPATDWLIDRLGKSQINTWLTDHGYRQTQLRHKMAGPRPDGPNVVSAAEMTKLLLAISAGELVSPQASMEMRRILLAQTRRTRIPAELPPDVIVGNKTGTLRGIVNDAAFVETPAGVRYAIAVLASETGSDAAVSRQIAALSAKVYELVSAAPSAASGVGPTK